MNLQQFAVTRNGSVNVSAFPRYSITGRLEYVNPETGLYENIANYTGANAIDFPAELKLRTPEEREAILQVIARLLIHMKAGQWTAN